jgi:hypothetical protein
MHRLLYIDNQAVLALLAWVCHGHNAKYTPEVESVLGGCFRLSSSTIKNYTAVYVSDITQSRIKGKSNTYRHPELAKDLVHFSYFIVHTKHEILRPSG